jgi:hypothetical protein
MSTSDDAAKTPAGRPEDRGAAAASEPETAAIPHTRDARSEPETAAMSHTRTTPPEPETAAMSHTRTTPLEPETAAMSHTRTTPLEPETDVAARRERGIGSAGAGSTAVGAAAALDRKSVLAREIQEFGGVKIGSAFFGWLTATGTAILLTALAAALGAASGTATLDDVAEEAARNPEGAGLVGVIVLLAILLIAYYCGGYVAGRMSRFNGARQGVAVWVWGVFIALVLGGLALVAGDRFDVPGQGGAIPRIQVGGDATLQGLIAALVAAAVCLTGAILGGLAGMRFHRRVDRAGFGD